MLRRVFKFAYRIAQVLLAVSVMVSAYQIVSGWTDSVDILWRDNAKPGPAPEVRTSVENSAEAAAAPNEPERGWGWSVFGWLLFCLFFPVATYKLIQTLLEKESNLTNVALLAGYSATDMLLAFALLRFRAVSLFPLILLILSAVLAVIYNYVILSYAERNRSMSGVI
jgi:hypothetical protein